MSEPSTTAEERIQQLEQQLREEQSRFRELQRSEARYRQVTEVNMLGVLFWHFDGRILEANDAVLKITGYSRDDLEQGRMNWLTMTPPEFMDRELVAHRQVLESGISNPYEKEYIRKDGSRVPILLGAALLPGSREEGVCYLLDITDRRRMEKQFADSKRLFDAFMENNPTIAFLKDAQGKRVYLNRRYTEVFGGAGLMGKTDAEMFSPEIAAKLQAEDDEVIRSDSPHKFVRKIPTPDGVNRSWLVYKFPLRDEEGALFLGGVALDITELSDARQLLESANRDLERRVAERTAALETANQQLTAHVAEIERVQESLRKSEHRRRRWLEQSVVPIQVISPAGFTVEVNPAWEKLWGVKLSDVQDRNMFDDQQMEDRGITEYFRRAFAGEAVVVPEVPYKPDRGLFAGQTRWCEGAVYPVKDEFTGAVVEIVVIHRDVTETKAMKQRLHEEERVMSNLFHLQEQERKLIAYEIHDGLVQDMVGGQMQLEAFNRSQSGSSLELLEGASQLFQKGISEARRLISDLRPLVIDEDGLIHAIQYLIAEEEQRSGLSIQFFHQVQFQRLPTLMEGTLFRIVQEAITNAKRHSGSEEIEVWFRQEGNHLSIRVRDYGCGFDPAKVPVERFGLEGIRRRAQIFGGIATIESHAGEGTTIRVDVPLDTEVTHGHV